VHVEDKAEEAKRTNTGGHGRLAAKKLANGVPPSPPTSPSSKDSRKASPTAKSESITVSDIKLFAKKRINGREVKMLVRAAQAIARNQKRPLSADDINKVLKVQEAVSERRYRLALFFFRPVFVARSR
jgi:hypothetical protein